MLVVSQLIHGVHRSHTEPDRLAPPVQVLDGLLSHPFRHVQLQQIHVLASIYVAGEHLHGGPFRVVHQGQQRHPLGLFDADELDEPVPTAVDRPGHHRAHPQPGSVRPQKTGRGRGRFGHAGARRERGEIHVLAPAPLPGRLHRGQGSSGRHGGGEDGGVVAGRLEGGQLGVAGRRRRHETPAAGMDDAQLGGHVLSPRTRHPERGDGCQYQLRIGIDQAGVVDPGAARGQRAQIVQQQIGLLQQADQAGNRALVGIEPTMHLVRPVPYQVGLGLHPHHVGAQVGQQLGRVGHPDPSGQLHHSNA